jgi:hypothetical protein
MIRRKKSTKLPRPVSISRFVYYFLLVIFLATLVYVFIFSLFLKVERVIVSGTEAISRGEVEKEVASFMEGKYWNFVPKNNLLLVSGNKLEDILEKKFVKINSIIIKKSFPNILNIRIEERKSLIIWCRGEVASGSCFIVDDKGYAYAEADLESQEVKENNLIEMVDSSGREINKGERILSDEYIAFISNIKDEVYKITGINIIPLYATPSRLSEELTAQTDAGWGIRFSNEITLDKSVRTLKTFLDKKVISDYSQLEYVDLRAENKVFYKLKNSEIPVSNEGEKVENKQVKN